MKLLFTGRGTSGSFQIRGIQLGRAIGAHVEPNAQHVDGYDVAVLVKRKTGNLVERLHRAKVPLVWDVVDSWPQDKNVGNTWNQQASLDWLGEQVREIRPAGIVAATNRMRLDCEKLSFGLPVLWLPHHARPGLAINPIRLDVRKVGYSGAVHYLGKWRHVLESECKRRRWKFVVGVEQLAEVDIVVAVRDATGYAARNWKSNVKLANAQGSGTPIICNRESGYMEIDDGALFVDTEDEMKAALDSLVHYEVRLAVSQQLRAATISLDHVAKDYKQWLQQFIQTK